MLTTPRTLAALILVAASLSACGGDDDTSTSGPAKGQGVPSKSQRGPSEARRLAICRTAVEDGLKLLKDFSNASRGVVAPNPRPYRSEARKMIREAKRAGCPVPQAIERQILQYLGAA